MAVRVLPVQRVSAAQQCVRRDNDAVAVGLLGVAQHLFHRVRHLDGFMQGDNGMGLRTQDDQRAR